MDTLVRFIKEDEGQDFVEYALLAAAIGAIGVAVIPRFRQTVIDIFNTAIDNMLSAAGS